MRAPGSSSSGEQRGEGVQPNDRFGIGRRTTLPPQPRLQRPKTRGFVVAAPAAFDVRGDRAGGVDVALAVHVGLDHAVHALTRVHEELNAIAPRTIPTVA